MYRFLIILTLLHFSLNAQDKPNIILINADDLGYGDLSSYGATMIKTPNIDQLAKEGRRFTDAHSTAAVCSPSRYGLLTGEYPFRVNFWGPLPIRTGLTINTEKLTIASMLKQANYETACIGKWHLGFGEKEPDWNGELKPGPLELGFDKYFGIPSVNSGPPFVYVEDHHVIAKDPSDPFQYKVESTTKKMPEKSGYRVIGGAKKAHELYVDDLLGITLKDRAVKWLKNRSKEKPFFLYFATTNIHHPFTPAKQFVGTSQCGAYGDFVHELDWMVGEIVKTVEEIGATENTLIIFTSDNGGMLNNTAQKAWKAGHRINGDLLGLKFGAWEGGHRVPLIIKWPGKIPANSKSDQLISQIDFLATFASIIDYKLKETEARDSINQLETITAEPESAARETLIIVPNSPKHLSIRHGDWVYIPQQGSGGFQGKKIGDHLLAGAAAFKLTEQKNSDIHNGKYLKDAPAEQLYNLKLDPRQSKNLIKDYPEVLKEMKQILAEYQKLIPEGKRTGWINLKQP